MPTLGKALAPFSWTMYNAYLLIARFSSVPATQFFKFHPTVVMMMMLESDVKVPYSENFRGVKTLANLAVSGHFIIEYEYEGIIINGRVITLDNSESTGIMDVAFLSLARQSLSNSGIPNCHVDMVAMMKGC